MARHMTLTDRRALEEKYNRGISIRQIAEDLGVNLSTIYKELKRGDTGKEDVNGRAGYSAELAQRNLFCRKQQLRYRSKTSKEDNV